MQVFSVIAKGGYVMYPIVACSVIALAVFMSAGTSCGTSKTVSAST